MQLIVSLISQIHTLSGFALSMRDFCDFYITYCTILTSSNYFNQMFTNTNIRRGNIENMTRIVNLDQRQKKLEEQICNIKINMKRTFELYCIKNTWVRGNY